MHNKFNRSAGLPENKNASKKNIRNTDNEKTQYFTSDFDNENTAEFDSVDYNQPINNRQSAESYNESQYRTPGRQQYYDSDGNPYHEGRTPQYNRQNPQYNQSGQPQYKRPNPQYNRNEQSQHSRPNPQYGQGGQPQYNRPNPQYDRSEQSQYNRPNSQYGQSGQPQQNRPNPQYDRNRNPQYNRSGAPQNRQQRPQENGRYKTATRSGTPTPQRSTKGERPQRKPLQSPPPRQSSRPPMPKNVKAPVIKKRRKKHIFLRIILIILVLFLVLFGVYSCASLSLIKKLNYQESGSRNHVAGALAESHVKSVLLIGTDGRSLDERGRSDTMILLSINKKTDEITLTSFMRDSYVSIPGYGWDKLNAAYSYGGADLLMDTIEQNFTVRVDDYISVNFISFAAIIDSVGGIEVDVSDAEAQEINTILMAEVNEIMGDAVDSDLLNSGGKMQLNGKQALSYARIRYIGNADFERTERQRAVLTKAAEKLKSFKPSMITDIAKNVVPQVTTNMSESELYMLSLRLPFIIRYDFKQVRIPADGTYGSAITDNGGSALSIDFDANYNILKEDVFGK